MNRIITTALALAAGILGGLLTRYIAPPAVFAQDQAAISKEVRAQSFTLVDASNRVVGTFTTEPVPGVAGRFRSTPNPQNPGSPVVIDMSPKYIVLRDSEGREIWSAGGNVFRRLSER